MDSVHEIDDYTVESAIEAKKDVDGCHPENTGVLFKRGDATGTVPCTPAAVMHMLDQSGHGVDLRGKHAVVIGESNIVGRPMGELLLKRGCTVTICHIDTVDIEKVVSEGDVVIAACGVPELVKENWIKPGAVVIDVGINAIDDPSKKSGMRLVVRVSAPTLLTLADVSFAV